MSDALHGIPGAASQPARAKSAKLVEAEARANEGLIRTGAGAAVLILLVIAAIVGIWQRVEGIGNLFILIGTIGGFFFGESRNKAGD